MVARCSWKKPPADPVLEAALERVVGDDLLVEAQADAGGDGADVGVDHRSARCRGTRSEQLGPGDDGPGLVGRDGDHVVVAHGGPHRSVPGATAGAGPPSVLARRQRRPGERTAVRRWGEEPSDRRGHHVDDRGPVGAVTTTEEVVGLP